MIEKELEGLKVSISDKNIIEDFTFSGNRVIATMGTVDGAVCAPILELKILSPSSIAIKGQSFEITWEDIQISEKQITTTRNGKPAIDNIKEKIVSKERVRRLP